VTTLVTGGAGLVARALVRHPDAPDEVVVTRRRRPTPEGTVPVQLDLCDAAAVDAVVAQLAPTVVVHAAYTVDDRRDIVDASRNVAAACARHGVGLVHLSTEAVFDGEHAPYGESEVPSPVHDYGRWKLEAEHVVAGLVPDAAIVRPSLVVGLDPPDPATRRVLESAVGTDDLVLFDDELRQPILVDDLAGELWAITRLDPAARAGVWHLPGAEVMSRAELGHRLCERQGVDDSRLARGRQRDHVQGPRPRDLTMLAPRRTVLGRAPRPI
jgi:dTDP-4-dehydrorhamnose reductase